MAQPSIFDLARCELGIEVAKRLTADMKPATDWRRSCTEWERADKSEQMGAIAAMPTKYRLIYGPIVEKLFHTHRGSDIVALLPDSPCEARPSNVHGLGVFAARDIPAYSYLTMYPCDAIRWQPAEWLRTPGLEDSVYKGGWNGKSTVENISYTQCLPPPCSETGNLSIVGNPKLFDEPHFLAHIINDGAMCKRPEAATNYEIASLKSKFTLRSRLHGPVHHPRHQSRRRDP